MNSQSSDGVEGTVLHDDSRIEVKRIVIQQGSETFPHSHGISSGHTFVAQGIIEVKTYDLNSMKLMRTDFCYEWDCCEESPGTIHIVKCIKGPAVIINVTRPPLRDTMVFYDKGKLRE